MKPIPAIFAACLFMQMNVFAQEPKMLPPASSHTNETEKPEYILSEEDFHLILENGIRNEIDQKKIHLLQEQTAALQARIALGDSAVAIRSLEARFWRDKLLQTDGELEKERLARTRIWNSRLLWFVVGAVTATVVIDAQ